ncbi:glucokinase [Dongia deserti]|uniref:glucokinase n=1 Tax=Dongia deserti TaxID=2268030 RepID=UPI000E65056D|nr:glucokinase [Dongia deserti]
MPQSADLLVADIGGTNARFAISDADGGLHELRVLHAANFPKVDEAITAYFADLKRPRPTQACFAVACPASGPEIKLTNSSWRFVKADLCQQFQFDRFVVINDFEALAASVPVLSGTQLAELRPGRADPTSVSLVIGPGTGLGVGAYVPAGKNAWAVISGEGGHVGFAPNTEEEVRLWRRMREKYGRVSAERVLNGAGLVNVYRFIADEAGQQRGEVDAPEISRRALAGEEVATNAVLMFFDMLGSVTGDLALAFGSRAGVYIGGGITPKLLDFARRSNFIDRFLDKGRVAAILQSMPIWVILEGRAALYGVRRQFDREGT